jgi:predicted DNA binding CopG/RHH family protein
MVNIRLSPEELREYRRMALEAGKSFSSYIRDILRSYAKHHKRKTGAKNLG